MNKSDLKNKYSNHPDITVHKIAGIPNGYCFFRKLMDHNSSKIGYLIACKDGSKLVSHVPVIYHENMSKEEKLNEMKSSEKKLLDYYAKL